MNEQNSRFSIGDSVTWMHQSQSGRSMSFSTREGKIIKLDPSGATVKSRNGKSSWILYEGLRLQGEKTGVSEVFEAMTKQVEKPNDHPIPHP